jgi:hypothetical protein
VHIPSESTGHEQLFSAGVKQFLFSHWSITLVRSRLFRKFGFQSPFRQFSRIPKRTGILGQAIKKLPVLFVPPVIACGRSREKRTVVGRTGF